MFCSMTSINPIESFNQAIEYGKYVTLATHYVVEHEDVIQKSINGEFDKEREIWRHRNNRGCEHFDIEWFNLSSSKEVFNESLWSAVRYRVINLKVCVDAYASDHGINKKEFYSDIQKILPSLKYTVPNGMIDSPFEILKRSRDIFAHDKDPSGNSYRASFGMNDIRSFLMTNTYVFDDGKDQRIGSYNQNEPHLVNQIYQHSGFLDYEYGIYPLYQILE